jgi:hypothetical protein
MNENEINEMTASYAVKRILDEFDSCCNTQGLPEDISFEKWALRNRLVKFIHKVYNVRHFFELEKQSNKE